MKRIRTKIEVLSESEIEAIHKSTLRILKNVGLKVYWFSKIFNRDNWDSWKSKNSPSLLDKAHEFVESATKNYKLAEPVIDKHKLDEINYIVKCADEELAKER